MGGSQASKRDALELLPAGVAVTEVLMEATGMGELTVSEWGLREGIIISTIAKHDRVEFSNDPRAIRYASVLSLCHRSRWPEAHSRQVAKLAVELFDSTGALHELDGGDRELLELAALLHDIGELVSRDGHARHSAYLIENGDLRGFSPVEIQMLACLGRYHVRGRPRESFPAWEALERADRDRVLKMLSLLRIADGLDAAHDSVIGHVGVERSGGCVEIVVSARGDAELERWMLQRKVQLFQELFEVPISLEVVPTGPEEMQTQAYEEAGLA